MEQNEANDFDILASKTLSAAKTTMILLMIVRAALFLASFKYKGLCRAFIYAELLMIGPLEAVLPADTTPFLAARKMAV